MPSFVTMAVRRKELGAQLAARHLHEPLHVFAVLLLAGHALEVLRHLLAREVDGRQHHVRRPFVAQLDDPLAEVGLANVQTLRTQVRVEADLLRRHALRLHDRLHAVLGGDLRDDLPRFCGIGRAVHDHAALLGLSLESRVQLLDVPRGVVLHVGDLADESASVDLLEDLVAAGAVLDGELVKRPPLEGVVQRLLDLAMVRSRRAWRFVLVFHATSIP